MADSSSKAIAETMLGDADSRSVQELNGFRFGIFGGAFIPNAIGWSGSGLLGGLPIAASGEISAHTGSVFGGLLGYQFTNYINLDFDIGYVSSTLEKFEGALSIADGPATPASAALEGSLHTLVGFLNPTILPLGRGQAGEPGRLWITPYIGGGPGIAFTTVKVNSLHFGPMNLQEGSSRSETNFAADIIVGVDVAITRRLELGASYEYVWISSGHLGTSNSFQASSGSISAHVLDVVLEYHI